MPAPTLTRNLVAEYQVRGTCLDSEGDEQRATEPVDGIAEAHMQCALILEYQERWRLPEDAEIWWRPGAGHAWRKWAAIAEQAVTA
ncbi:hypothetical protein DMB42_11840 [Nonomuraea sp. WAC 01424]|uniref:hypothetical protein n=1 Tax=Nonomuraea sp. WAC 01424 TaxID=2203200 RepID=UPI000F77BE17|nr:hypothetical protein [Nonomuraea sp. WAC 01424]RSN12862.1 hypothetical protein DMB42_11840 [Nonomuraea sp. WAC 01424]